MGASRVWSCKPGETPSKRMDDLVAGDYTS